MAMLRNYFLERKIKLKEKKTFSNLGILLKAIGINILFFIVMGLLFKPVWTVDNAVISNTIYGAYGETYDYHANYTSFLYAKIVVFFLNCFPGLPWYTILENLWIFFAFSLMTYLIFEKFNNLFGTMVNIVLLVFFSYEGYACPQFTKTAAILSAIGIFSVLCSKKRFLRIFLGVLLFSLGALIRVSAAEMALGAWGCILILHVMIAFLKKNRNLIYENLIILGLFGSICLSILLINNFIKNESNESDEWRQYKNWTFYRALIQDYQVPDYAEFINEYEEMGVSENDLLIWRSWNNDPNIMKVDIMQEIVQLSYDSTNELVLNIFNFSNIFDFFKIFPKSFLYIDSFYAYLLILLFCMFATQKKNFINVLGGGVSSILIYMLLNYYLFIKGRYLVHRVDIGLAFVVCLTVIYWMNEEMDFYIKNKEVKFAGAITCLLLVVPYKNYSDDIHPVTEEQQTKNKYFFSETSNDTEHYYTIVSDRNNTYAKFSVFNAWDCVPIGFFRNIYGCTQPTPKIKDLWKAYNITNPYLDALNNDLIYLVFDKDSTMQEAMKKYIEEHTGEKVELILVKDYLDKKVYRAFSKPLEELYNFENTIDESNKLKGNVKAVLENEDSEESNCYLTLSGNMHINKESGFAQNTYLLIEDKESDEKTVCSIKQSEDSKGEYVSEGYFSNLNAEVELPEYYDEDDSLYLIIESKGTFYRTKLLVETNINNG